MQHKRKKKTRMRGSETHGYGASKKHRGAGHRGGRGKAGSGKRGDAKIMKITKGNKNYLGKYGFTSKTRKKIMKVNVAYIQNKLHYLLSKKLIKKEKDIYIINLKDLGFNKLLAKGNINNKFKISTEYASKNVIRKVQEAGGEVIISNLTKENVIIR